MMRVDSGRPKAESGKRKAEGGRNIHVSDVSILTNDQ